MLVWNPTWRSLFIIFIVHHLLSLFVSLSHTTTHNLTLPLYFSLSHCPEPPPPPPPNSLFNSHPPLFSLTPSPPPTNHPSSHQQLSPPALPALPPHVLPPTTALPILFRIHLYSSPLHLQDYYPNPFLRTSPPQIRCSPLHPLAPTTPQPSVLIQTCHPPPFTTSTASSPSIRAATAPAPTTNSDLHSSSFPLAPLIPSFTIVVALQTTTQPTTTVLLLRPHPFFPTPPLSFSSPNHHSSLSSPPVHSVLLLKSPDLPLLPLFTPSIVAAFRPRDTSSRTSTSQHSSHTSTSQHSVRPSNSTSTSTNSGASQRSV